MIPHKPTARAIQKGVFDKKEEEKKETRSL